MEELKEGWRKVKLGEIVEYVARGITPKYTEEKESILVINQKCIRNMVLNLELAKKHDLSKKISKDKILKKYDILINSTGVGTLGRVCQNFNDTLLTVDSHVTILRADSQKINPLYLGYAIKNKEKLIESLGEGSTGQTELKKDILLERIQIDYPQNSFLQKKIVSILSSLDEKIELNRKINQNLEEIAQTLFKRWFIDFEFPNEEGKPYKSSGGKMSESELEEIPVGWRVAKLGDFIKFIKGKKPKILVEKEDGINKFKYLTIKSINNEEENYCSDEKVIFVSKNEIMMVMDGASSGDIYIGKEGVLGSTLSKIEIDKSIDWSIVYYLLNYYKNEIKQHNTGSAIPHTDKNYIENITFFLPNNKKINYFSKIFKSILLKKIALEDEIYKLIELRDYLLPRLMSGEIDISNLKISEISNSD